MPRFTTNAVLAVAIALGLGGCAHSIYSGTQARYPDRNEVPIATNFETSPQLKLQAAGHWKRVAYDAADGLAKSLRAGGATTLFLRRSCETTECAPRACETTFNRIFHNEFLTALVDRGYQVSAVPTPNAAVVEIDVQAVSFSANRPQYRYAGEPVEIGPGVWALRDTSSLIDSQGATALRTENLATNWYRTEFAGGATPRNEVVITVSALSSARSYLARNTKVYYTSDADAAHYFCSASGPQERQRARLSTIPVVGDCTEPRCAEAAPGRPR